VIKSPSCMNLSKSVKAQCRTIDFKIRRARKKANTDSNYRPSFKGRMVAAAGSGGLWYTVQYHLSWCQTSKDTSRACDLGNVPHIEKKSLTRHRISFRHEGPPIGCPRAARRQKWCVEEILRLGCWKVRGLRYLPPEPCPAAIFERV
jgi:hypothetical protein